MNRLNSTQLDSTRLNSTRLLTRQRKDFLKALSLISLFLSLLGLLSTVYCVSVHCVFVLSQRVSICDLSNSSLVCQSAASILWSISSFHFRISHRYCTAVCNDYYVLLITISKIRSFQNTTTIIRDRIVIMISCICVSIVTNQMTINPHTLPLTHIQSRACEIIDEFLERVEEIKKSLFR